MNCSHYYYFIPASKFIQVFRIFLNMLVDFNTAMHGLGGPILSLISSSPSLSSRSLKTLSREPTAICVTLNFIFNSFLFSSLARPKNLFAFYYFNSMIR